MNPELITQIFELCIIPLLGVLVRYVVKYCNAKADLLTQQTNNQLTQKYIKLIVEKITDCVIATNQTYVESLKKQGKFDAEAQKKAFQESYNAVIKILTEDEKAFIEELSGDLPAYLTSKIEAIVNKEK